MVAANSAGVRRRANGKTGAATLIGGFAVSNEVIVALSGCQPS
jgi:hypothetical protein